jgi:hypothetical protein
MWHRIADKERIANSNCLIVKQNDPSANALLAFGVLIALFELTEFRAPLFALPQKVLKDGIVHHTVVQSPATRTRSGHIRKWGIDERGRLCLLCGARGCGRGRRWACCCGA